MQHNAKKSLGQHFLVSQDICRDIINSSIPITGRTVVEVGPGHGALTEVILAELPKKLILIEKDDKLARRAESTYSKSLVLNADALELNLSTLCPPDEKLIIIANLPYNIGSKLLSKWLVESSKDIEHMTLMLQQEVVDRIVAEPGSTNYSRLSVIVAFFASAEKSFDVPPECFSPPPKVMSSIVQITPTNFSAQASELEALERVLDHCFKSRRKMLRKIFKGIMEEEELKELGIDPNMRPQNLSLEQYLLLAKHLKQHSKVDID